MDPKAMISWEDYQGCLYAFFEWAESYDTKDWIRLHKITAPTLHINYSAFLPNSDHPALSIDDYISMISSPAMLGDPTLTTRHFLGASTWQKVSNDEIVGHHQLKVSHLKYTDETRGELVANGVAHSTNRHWYRRIEGRWLFAGLEPVLRFVEGDFEGGSGKKGEGEGGE